MAENGGIWSRRVADNGGIWSRRVAVNGRIWLVIESVKEPRGICLVIESMKEIQIQQLETKLSLMRILSKSMPMLVTTKCILVTREVSITVEGFKLEKN